MMNGKMSDGDSPRVGPFNPPIWNSVIDSRDAQLLREAAKTAKSMPGSVRGSPPKAVFNPQTRLFAQNNTGRYLRRGDVVEFEESVLADLDNNQFCVSAKVSNLARHAWGIMLEPVENLASTGAIQWAGHCLGNGLCVGLVNITNPEHRFARREADSTVFQSAWRGAVKIVHPGPILDGGSGERECLVHILDDTPNWYLGIVREKYTQGSTSAKIKVDIYVRDIIANKWRKVPGPPIEAEDWFLQKEEELDKLVKVRVDWYINCWAVTDMYCEPTDLDEFKPSSQTGSPGEMEASIGTSGGGESPANYSPGLDSEA